MSSMRILGMQEIRAERAYKNGQEAVAAFPARIWLWFGKTLVKYLVLAALIQAIYRLSQ